MFQTKEERRGEISKSNKSEGIRCCSWLRPGQPPEGCSLDGRAHKTTFPFTGPDYATVTQKANSEELEVTNQKELLVVEKAKELTHNALPHC